MAARKQTPEPPPRSFRTPAAFRAWLTKNHATATVLILRCFKVHASHRGIGYKEALDEALCFGWIDGVRRGLDDDSYTQRFTPRKANSNWSQVNIKRVGELEAAGRMHSSGLAAFRARGKSGPSPYSSENRAVAFDAACESTFRSHPAAWQFFQAQPPGYRRICAFFVMSAKRAETRARRLSKLIECSTDGQRLPMLGGNKAS